MTDREAYIAFNLTEQVGSVKVADLVARFGSVVSAWENYPQKISRTGGEVDWKGELQLAKKYKVTVVTPADADYPERLLGLSSHPLALYVRGDLKALSKSSVAIVGTRRATDYGLDQAYRFGRDLAANGWAVVSGLALGIDAAAHKGALEAGGVTVGVIGSALDRFYPEENRLLAREIVEKGGAVVSEFPFGRDPDQQTFPQRNHVVAALATGVLAVESPLRSGTLITTSIAAEIGRIVMALPGRVDSRSSAGCLKLIREGARMVRSARDVEEELGELFPRTMRKPSVKSPSTSPDPLPPAMSVEEAMIVRELDVEGIYMDELVKRSGLPAAKVSSLCMELRMKGRVRFLRGNRIALPRSD